MICLWIWTTLSSFIECQILFWQAAKLILDPLDLIFYACFYALIGWQDCLDFVIALDVFFTLGLVLFPQDWLFRSVS